MGRKPGTKKTGGRKAGTPNKVTTDLRESVHAFVSKNWSKVQAEFDSLEAKDKLAFLDKMMQYALPRLQAVQLDGEIDFNSLDEQKLDSIIEKILSNGNTPKT